MLWYGGDYNPEQWPREVWAEDIALMQRAGVTVATVGVFAWAKLEPADGAFDFAWLDDVIDGLHEAGIGVDLATATASPPPWLTAAHPDVLAVEASGRRWSIGSRAHHNPGSPTFRYYADRLVGKLAERYAHHPALVAWHVGNEFGNEVPRDYGAESAAAFRTWLRARYGTLERLNDAWGTAFWSQQYGSFEEVQPARDTPTFPNPAQALDYERFGSDALIAAYRAEAAILRAANPAIPITTNFMGPFKPADYWKWAQEVDFVSDDCYPDPLDPEGHIYGAMRRDLLRSLAGGKPWLLMEQSTSAVNWRPINGAKRPGQMRALSYQAIARGADGIMFFQWRQAARGAEKFHSAMLPSAGTGSRIWREVTQLGHELGALEGIAGTPVEPAQVAILFDWESWWAVEQKAMPARTDYLAAVTEWYSALHELGVLVDFARPTDDLSGYRAVLAVSTTVLSDDAMHNLDRYVREGGHLVATYLTGVLDPAAGLMSGGPLGSLTETFGIEIDEVSPRPPVDQPEIRARLGLSVEVVGEVAGPVGVWAEIVRTTGASAVARYGPGDLEGSPAITRHPHGRGIGWYVSAELERPGCADLLRIVAAEAGVSSTNAPPGVEIVRRGDLVFAINHRITPVRLSLPGRDALTGAATNVVELAPFDVAVLHPSSSDEPGADDDRARSADLLQASTA
ncbi:beta-galactosidase [Microbacterium sp. EST19A]|uniref:beta-galactosidase n=1 Tax=Microbacterium sp. EST19A TaxID=2862681 RepID=UPI001CBEFB82|nr:beta-galactosidase [Microbacterium sp. EST19A]